MKKDEIFDSRLVKSWIRKENIKRFHTKYQRRDILLVLSIILAIQIFIIIRYSQWSLMPIFNNKLVKNLFLPKGEDRTLYNIAISYIAAYIFYIIQVYIPSYMDHFKNIDNYRKIVKDEVNILQEILFLESASKGFKENETHYHRLSPFTDDLINHIDYTYTSNKKKELLSILVDKHANNLQYICSISIDNTLKTLHNNLFYNEYDFDSSFLEALQKVDEITNKEHISFLFRRVAWSYFRKIGILKKYKIISDYMFVSEEKYNSNDCIIEAKKYFSEILKVRK